MRDISENICVRLILYIQMLLYSITDTGFLELIYMYFCLFIPCFEKFYINDDFFLFSLLKEISINPFMETSICTSGNNIQL